MVGQNLTIVASSDVECQSKGGNQKTVNSQLLSYSGDDGAVEKRN